MELKTTSKQADGKILRFDAEVSNDTKYPLVVIRVYEGDYFCCSYYLGTLSEWGDTRAWCVTSGRYEPYRAVNETDAVALITEGNAAFPNDASEYRERFTARQ